MKKLLIVLFLFSAGLCAQTGDTTRAVIKTYFYTGAYPTASQMHSFINSVAWNNNTSDGTDKASNVQFADSALKIWNPANTFFYVLRPQAITTMKYLYLPITTAREDTLVSSGRLRADNFLLNGATTMAQVTVNGSTTTAGTLNIAAASLPNITTSITGSATLSSGVVKVANSLVTSTCRILITGQDSTNIANWGVLEVTRKISGSGFIIRSTNASDARTVGYLIFEPYTP